MHRLSCLNFNFLKPLRYWSETKCTHPVQLLQVFCIGIFKLFAVDVHIMYNISHWRAPVFKPKLKGHI